MIDNPTIRIAPSAKTPSWRVFSDKANSPEIIKTNDISSFSYVGGSPFYAGHCLKKLWPPPHLPERESIFEPPDISKRFENITRGDFLDLVDNGDPEAMQEWLRERNWRRHFRNRLGANRLASYKYIDPFKHPLIEGAENIYKKSKFIAPSRWRGRLESSYLNIRNGYYVDFENEKKLPSSYDWFFYNQLLPAALVLADSGEFLPGQKKQKDDTWPREKSSIRLELEMGLLDGDPLDALKGVYFYDLVDDDPDDNDYYFPISERKLFNIDQAHLRIARHIDLSDEKISRKNFEKLPEIEGIEPINRTPSPYPDWLDDMSDDEKFLLTWNYHPAKERKQKERLIKKLQQKHDLPASFFWRPGEVREVKRDKFFWKNSFWGNLEKRISEEQAKLVTTKCHKTPK